MAFGSTKRGYGLTQSNPEIPTESPNAGALNTGGV